MASLDLRAPSGARVVVVGGANTDYVGMPADTLVERVSNPGTIRTSPGGVARNIAENLARLGVSVELITAFGDDESAHDLAEACRRTGIGIEGSILADGAPGARYLAINDEAHDLAVAVSDMRVLDMLTPQALASPSRAGLIGSADVVVADTNLSAETMQWLAENTAVPLVIDPVSAAKASRIAELLPGVAAVKPNAQEAEALTGMSIGDLAGAEAAACDLVRRGVSAAFVTPGAMGVSWADAEASGHIRSPGVTPVNASGAGDAFTAGIAYAMLAGAGTQTQAQFASALSIVALDSHETVNPRVSHERVLALMVELYGGHN